jgi:hypothetical protein
VKRGRSLGPRTPSATALGVPPPNTATMNAAEFQTFVKNARNVVLGNATGDQKTDTARQILAEGFADPHLQPKAVRRILAQSLGNLDAADDYYRDVTGTLQRVPHLDRSQRASEFNKAHPIEDYYKKHEKDIAVRGDLPEKFDKADIGRAYIMTPEEMLQRFPKNANVTLSQIRDKWFGGQGGPRRFRIGPDGKPVPDGR